MSKLISYAQNFEDIILWRALSHVSGGCYVDVGAQSPDSDSVSRLFYEHGWRGVHVEPAPLYADLLRTRRPDELVLQLAVGNRLGIVRFFFIADSGLSTTDPEIAEKHRVAGFDVAETRVPAATLDAVLKQIPGKEVHWLKIDVEGAERLVIDGWKTARPRPWVLVIESTRPLSSEQSHEEWEPAVLARGYDFVYFDGLNRFYVSHEHPELKTAFCAGPNVFDNFSLSSSSQFCALVNLDYHELKVLSEQRQLADEARLRECDVKMQALARQLEEQATESEQRQAQILELSAQVDAGRQEAHRWWSAHEELEATLNNLQKQLEMCGVENERRQVEHARAIDAMVQAQRRLVSEHHAALTHAFEQAQCEVLELAVQVDAGREEAHRWWLAHEGLLGQLNELRAQLSVMERSHSWQLTSPLRAARRRLAINALTPMKQMLRPLILKSIRVVFSVPWLYRVLKPAVTRVPYLYGRLRAMAMREHLRKSALLELESENLPLVTLEGCEHDHTVVYLDKRAARVLSDLKQSRNWQAVQ